MLSHTKIRATFLGAITLTSAYALAACGGGDKPSSTPAAPATPATTAAKPSPTGKVIVIDASTDDKGSYFKPNSIDAKAGDVLRFTLVQGVHNVNFVPDSNPGVANLPPISDFMQLPGQTIDIVVPDAPGKTLYFQCDPHALLGMIGHVRVN
ncbi:MAG: plastocyanin/azurin family copper-binding protein [Gemmatimonadaceae bacterium]